jgi:hypothetical protein
MNCEYSTLCPDVVDSAQLFGPDEYVGHDEPSLLFYSNKPGAGNRMQYSVTLPTDPTPSHPTQPGKGYNFELNGSLWFGMAHATNSPTQSRYRRALPTVTATSSTRLSHPSTPGRHSSNCSSTHQAGCHGRHGPSQSERTPAARPSGVPR